MNFLNVFIAHWIIWISFISLIIFGITSLAKGKLKRDSFVDLLAVFIFTGSIIAGLKLSYNTLFNSLIPNASNIEDSEITYTFLGGIAVAWLAIWELINRYKDLNDEESE